MKHESHEVAEPDIEIIVRTGERELAVIGIFEAGLNNWDVIIGIDASELRGSVQAALQLGIDAVSRADFSPLRTLGDRES